MSDAASRKRKSTTEGFNLANYLKRIGLSSALKPDLATLASIMEAHSRSIAFENVDVVLGRKISMAKADVEKKLVDAGRGGYCWEQNTLLAMALEAVGFATQPLMCRVRWNKAPDEEEPNTTYTHFALKVTIESEAYLADVGFSGVNSIAPIRLSGTRDVQTLPEGQFRVVDGTSPLPGYSMLQLLVKGDWRSLYTWRDVRAPLVDQECSNWFSCTFPSARFTTSFFACRVVGSERHHILNGEYVVRKGHGVDREQTSVPIRDRAHLVTLLRDVFLIQLGPEDMEGPLGVIDRYLPGSKPPLRTPRALDTPSSTIRGIPPRDPPSILDKIVAQRRLDVEAACTAVPASALHARIAARAPAHDFAACVRVAAAKTNGLCVLAEMKRASPSKGDIAVHIDAPQQALAYAMAGACTISTLTEPKWFKGSLTDLEGVRAALEGAGLSPGVCVLRKDFVVDEYMLLEARAHGADTVLLIVAVLTPPELAALMAASRKLGMEPLVEVNTTAEMTIALEAGARVIGVNNRNLHTFEVDMGTTGRIAAMLPAKDPPLLLALSGVATRDDAVAMQSVGSTGILVGESLMRAPTPGTLIRALLGQPEPQ